MRKVIDDISGKVYRVDRWEDGVYLAEEPSEEWFCIEEYKALCIWWELEFERRGL